MSGKTRLIGSLQVALDRPTELTFSDLHDWVLWQFPTLQRGWLLGAAHPPESAYGWIPVRIQPLKHRVQLFAHPVAPMPSPEAAANWLTKQAEW